MSDTKDEKPKLDPGRERASIAFLAYLDLVDGDPIERPNLDLAWWSTAMSINNNDDADLGGGG